MLLLTPEWDREVEIEIKEDEKTTMEDCHDPDLYDLVYSNIPNNTHMLKTMESCRFCDSIIILYESKGLCCKKGQIKLANPETPLELTRLWTSNDSDVRHFQNNIRFFNGHFSFTSLYCHLDCGTTDMQQLVFIPFKLIVISITINTHLLIVA